MAEEVNGTGVEPFLIVITPGDASVAPPPIRPALEAVAHATNGSGYAVSSCNVMVVPGHGLPIAGTFISVYATSTPVVADASSTICSPPIRSIAEATICVASGFVCAIAADDVAVTTGCSTLAVCASYTFFSVCPSADTVAAVGGTCLVGAMATLALLLLNPGMAPADDWRAN